MGKTLETKKKIMSLLKKKDMTITELSKQLGLSGATISQHLSELQRIGAVEKVDNEHYKKLKYYKAREERIPVLAKYGISLIVVALAILLLYFYRYWQSPGVSAIVPSQSVVTTGPCIGVSGQPCVAAKPNSTANASATNATQPGIPRGGAFACPMEWYRLSGNISNSSGFKAYTLNYSGGKIMDYVIPANSTGQLYVNETISEMTQSPGTLPSSRQHSALLQRMGNSPAAQQAFGVNLTVVPSNYTVIYKAQANFVIFVAANATAMPQTYWVRIDWPCVGSVAPALLTVGNGPYSGNIIMPVNIYA